MPVVGRKPKPDGQKRTRHPLTQEWVDVPDRPFAGDVPDLPERVGGWPVRTLRKWAAWSVMPHCALWAEPEWDFAVDSLEIAAQFHEGNARLATELRNRERVLGTTLDFRRDLRIRYVDPAPGEEAEVKRLDDYRDAL